MSSKRRTPWLAALLLAAALPPPSASAQWYWLPGLEECQQEGYLDDASSYLRYHCRGLLEDEIAEQHDDGERAGTVLSERVAELDSSFSAQPNAVEAIRLDEITAGGAGGERSSQRDLEHWIYSYDGDDVDTCDEYVWQRFYDYEQLMRAASRAATAREVFETAYGGTGDAAIASRGLWGWSRPMRAWGVSYTVDQAELLLPELPDHWPGTAGIGADNGVDVIALPKNDYFALSDEELAMVRPLAYSLWLRLRQGRSYYHMSTYRSGESAPDGWEWHQMMSDAMRDADVPDAELRVLAEGRRDFRRLLEQRRSLRRRGFSNSSSEVRAVNAQIIDALRDANDDGCLAWDASRHDPASNRYDIGRCDWAPEDFVQAVTRTFDALAGIHRRACERLAPSNLGTLSSGYDYYTCSNLDACEHRTTSDPRTSVHRFTTFLQRADASEGHVLEAFTDENQAPELHFDAGDSHSWGDSDLVSASFSYWATGGVVDDAWSGGEVDTCDVNPNLDVGARLTGSVFGHREDLAEARIELDARRNRRVLTMELFGHDYYAGGWEYGGRSYRGELDWTRTGGGDDSHAEDLPGFDERFFIGPVPVSMSAEIVATIGLRAGFEVDVYETTRRRDYYGNVGGCDTDGEVGVEVEPYVDVSLHGRAGVDALLFEGGVEADVVLANVSLPAHIRATVDDGYDGPELRGDSAATLRMTSLSGRIGGYVEAIGERYSATFLSWPSAFDEPVELYDNDFDYSFAELETCGHPQVTCGR